MKHRWEAEFTVDPFLAQVLIQEQFPFLQPNTIRLMGAGWDNTAYLINDRYVFRFPRRAIAVSLIEIESTVLPHIAPHLPLSIPFPEWRGSAGKNYPWPFIGYRYLQGQTACHAKLSDEERIGMVKIIAQFLSSLHRLSISFEIPGDLLGRLDVRTRTERLQKNLEELDAHGLFPKKHSIEDFILSNVFRTAQEISLVHGDFYVRHLLIDNKRHLSGIIDWGDVHKGDPAVDLSFAHSFLPLRIHDQFRYLYGEISEETWKLALFRALYHTTTLFLYAFHSKDRILMEECRYSLLRMAQQFN